MDSEPYIIDQHYLSKRYVIFEDNQICAYLYLTVPDGSEFIADVFVYNRNEFQTQSASVSRDGEPPPLPKEFVNENTICHNPAIHKWEFLWSIDGNSVALLKDKQPIAFIDEACKPGFSRAVNRSGPWAKEWSETEYKSKFRTG